MMVAEKVIDIQKEVNPNFQSVWTTKKPFNILKGGRNSFKSSVVVLLLVYMMVPYLMRGEKANIVVIRKVGNTIRDSVFNKVQWALGKFFLMDEFKATVVPFKITHKRTGSTFYFYGQDDFQKLKSNDINNIIAVWYEEAAEFSSAEEFDQTNITFMRQQHPKADMVRFFWSYNPPRNPYEWINEWAEQMKAEPDYLVHESSYLDDRLNFVTDLMLADIERIKRNDFDYYRYIYLGEPVGLGTNVYNAELMQPIKELPDDEYIIYIAYSTDSGHQVSATTTLCVGYTNKGNVVLLDTDYYSPAGKVNKKAPSEMSKDLNQFVENTKKRWGKPVQLELIDSAEGALRNQYFLDYNIRLNTVNKQKKIVMIDYAQNLFAQGRFYYLESKNNQVFVDEHRKYMWNEKTVHTENPRVIEIDDHTCDAFQYLVITMASRWGLKV